MSDCESDESANWAPRSKRKHIKSKLPSSDSESDQSEVRSASKKPNTRGNTRKTPKRISNRNNNTKSSNKDQLTSESPATRSSERLKKIHSREFSLPDREKVLETISPGNLKHPELEEERVKALRPRRLVNNFIRECNSYATERVADCWGSDSSLSDFIADSDEEEEVASSSSSGSESDASRKINKSACRRNSRVKAAVESEEEITSPKSRAKSLTETQTSDSESSDVPLATVKNKIAPKSSVEGNQKNANLSDDEFVPRTQKRRLSNVKKVVIRDSSDSEMEEESLNTAKQSSEGPESPVKDDLKSSRPKSKRVRTLRKQDKKRQIFEDLLEKRKRAKLDPKTRLAKKQEKESIDQQAKSPETSSESEREMAEVTAGLWDESGDSDEYEKDFVVSNDETESEDGMNSDEASQFMKLLDTYTHKGGNGDYNGNRTGEYCYYKTPRKCRKKKTPKWNRIATREESDDSDDSAHGDVETIEQQKHPPLHLAVIDNDMDAVKKLLQTTPDSIYDIGQRGRTALHLAAMQGNAEIVRVLLRHGADRTVLDRYHFPALAYAANGHSECLNILLERADIKTINKVLMKTSSSMSLLHFAIGDDRSGLECSARGRCMEMLFSSNKKACQRMIEHRDSKGRTPLAAAVYAGQHQCVAILLKYGANGFAFKRESGGNLLHFAVECASYLDKEEDVNTSLCLRQLLEPLKLQVDQPDETTGFTPLMLACASGNADCVAALLEADATVMCTDSHKTSALHLAAMAGDTKCVQLLLDSRHQVDCLDMYGWPPLLYANFKAQESCVLALMKPKPEQLFVLGDLLKMPRNDQQKKKTFKVVKNALISLANHDAYYTVFNDFIRRNPEMLEENNHGLLQHTWRAILDFDNKQHWFKRKLQELKSSTLFSWNDCVSLQVDRNNILGSTMQQMGRVLGHTLRRCSLSVTFLNEPGICTGPKREFFVCFCKDIVDPMRGLFMATDDSQFSPVPNAYFAKFIKEQEATDQKSKDELSAKEPASSGSTPGLSCSATSDSGRSSELTNASESGAETPCDNTASANPAGENHGRSTECTDAALLTALGIAESRETTRLENAQASVTSDVGEHGTGENADVVPPTSSTESGIQSMLTSDEPSSSGGIESADTEVQSTLGIEVGAGDRAASQETSDSREGEVSTPMQSSLDSEASLVGETSGEPSTGDAGISSNQEQANTWISCQDWKPKAKSTVNLALRSKLKQLRLIGRLVGAAICDNMLLSLHLSKPFVKQILGIPLSHPDDLSSFDHELHKNAVTWVLENSVDCLELPFSIDTVNPWTGQPVTVDLSDDKDKALCDANKREYVKLVSQFKLQESIKVEAEEFAAGLDEVVPRDLLSFFTADEFSLLINGVSKIDVADWKANTSYRGCSSSDQIITWMWNTISGLKEEEKALLLKFSTGSPCVPIGGFATLQGLSGTNKFTVTKLDGMNKIPQASTCFNLLKLTDYDSEKQLREKLLIAIRHGSEGFSFS